MTRWLPVVGAVVIWRSERRDDERPQAIEWGGQRLEVDVLERWVEGPSIAGSSLRYVFLVADPSGRELRVSRSGGAVTVELRYDG